MIQSRFNMYWREIMLPVYNQVYICILWSKFAEQKISNT
jgi:hypothetical protein